jgi:hypothetical protein
MRRCALALCLIALIVTPAALPQSARQRCDIITPLGAFVDCFSGAYHGTGFMPMEETISFHLAGTASLHANGLWRLWVGDSKRTGNRKPCTNTNAVPYVGSFSFYGSGSFIACSQSRPSRLSGYFRLKRSYFYTDQEGPVTLTHGMFSATIAHDNVMELVFSDASQQNYAQPEVVLGHYTP